MTDPATVLKFAQIQAASEAFLERAAGDDAKLSEDLHSGNRHATLFPKSSADRFASEYTVVAHQPNTKTGFSGTLFRDKTTNELVLSFRSTEFVDDSLRDAKSTCDLEVARLGWALGQIADMEKFYAELKATNKISGTDVFYVTGYSLGGHLATAFNLLRQEAGEAERVVHTYTFNGAGTGGLLQGAQLQTILADFKDWWQNPSHIPWERFSPSQRANIEQEAVSRVQEILAEEARLLTLGSKIPFNPRIEELSNLVAAKDLNYQVAVLAATFRRTTASSGLPFRVRGENIVPTSPLFASSRISNMTEIVGMDSGNLGPSFIANSGIHYGERQSVFIEDQPLYRGNFDRKAAIWNRELLQDTYPESSFGDTHSIVLLVDSLSVMDVFARLASAQSGLTQQHIEKILAASSRAGAEARYGTPGKAEGDTLENALDPLRRLIVDADAARTGTDDDLIGGTWHAKDARNRFHQNIEVLNAQIALSGLTGHLAFTAVPALDALITGAKLDGGAGAAWRYALVHLNPFIAHGDSTLLRQYAEEKYAKYDSEHRDGLTDAYIRDRAAFLAWKNEDFLANGKRTLRSTQRATYEYVDKGGANGSDLEVTVLGRMFAPGTRPVNVVFGKDGAEVITGGTVAGVDRLYGGGGDDVLGGGEDNDYLEGNAGDDTLDGGSGADVLVGGSGDDTLRGGTELDTYIVGVGDDQVIDEDGCGILMDADGNRIDGLFVQRGSGYVLSDEPEITATLGDSLEITLANGATVVIHDFDDGDLGLQLTEKDAQVPISSVTDLTQDADFHVVISNGPTAVRGLGGNDFIGVAYINGNILIEGGAGGDAVAGNDGDDRLFGGTQSDVEPLMSGIASENGDREAVYGAHGNDLVVGGNGTDWLAGGGGDDEIYGGPGDDLIAGGGDIYGSSYWKAGGPRQPSVPVMQDTMVFNVDMGETSPADDVYAYLQANGRIARGAFPQLRSLDDQDGSDTIIAGSGSDEVWAGWGDDYVSGDAGEDTLIGEEGADTLFGGEGDDIIHGDSSHAFGGPDNHGGDYIDGGDGDDRLCGWGADDTIFGGDGNDRLTGDDESLDSAYHGGDYLDGEGGNDLLAGQGGDDQLFGGDGQDELQGGDGNDYIDGEGGVDTVFGGAGEDEIRGGAGDDQLLGESGADYIEGEAGADSLFGDSGDDTLLGGDGADTLYGQADADGLFGGNGNDLLDGGEGDDVLSGGQGDDTLMGGAGDDVYSFAAGDGRDTLIDAQGANTIRFTGAWTPADLKIVQSSSGEARIQHGYSGDALVLSSGLAASVQHFQFADGSVRSLQETLDLADADPVTLVSASFGANLYGGSNDDTLTAGPFSRLDGGRGNDTLTSAGDFVTFDFAAGDGHDVVRNVGYSTFEFDASVSRAALAAFRMDASDPAALTPRDLLLQYGDADNPDTIAIADDARSPSRRYQFVDGSMSHVELLERSGLGLDWLGTDEDETVAGTRNADRLSGEHGRDTLDGGRADDELDGGAAADVLRGGAGNDTLIGNVGNDTLEGGAGDDRYVIRAGDGLDVLIDNAGANVLDFGPGIALSDVGAALVGGSDGNLYLAVNHTAEDAVLVRQNFGDAAGDGTFTFRFSDGTQITSTELASRKFRSPLDFRGTDQALRIAGSGFDDVVIGSTRDDRIEGGDGNDRLAGNAGADCLSGGAGDDFLVGNTGDDVLEGGSGRDVYRFHHGMGKDLIIEAGGQNTLMFDANIERTELAYDRSGDDLYVHIAHGRDGVRIRDYFVSCGTPGGQSWQVRFGEEPATALEGLIGVIETVPPPATIEALMADFSLRVRTHYESLLLGEGYRRGGDGRLMKEEVASGDYYSRHSVTSVGFAYAQEFDDSAWIWSDVVSLELLDSSYASTRSAHTFQQLVTAGGRYAPMGAGRNVADGRVVHFSGDPDDISTSNDEDTFVYLPGELIEESPFSGASIPNAFGGGSYGFGAGTTQYTTQTVIRTHGEETYDYRLTLGALTAGGSANEIAAQPFGIIDGGAGDDRLSAGDGIVLPEYRLASTAGAPGAFLFGNSGNDTISGGACDDVLIGGHDNDTLVGGFGNDLYVVLPGDGFDQIIEHGATIPGVERENVLRLPEGVTLQDLSQTLTHELATNPQLHGGGQSHAVRSLYAFLTLTWGGTDGVRLMIPHADDGAGHGVDYVEFADGSRIALPDLVARIGGELDPYGLDNDLSGAGIVDGGPGDDVVRAQLPVGAAGRDTLIGTEGNDELFGGAFHDRVLVSSARFGTMWDEGNTYRGGAGDDQIWATAGADTFEFELGDGCDTVSDVQHDSLYLSYGGALETLAPELDAAAHDPAHRDALLSNTDTIRFGIGVTPNDIDVVRIGSQRDSSGRSDALVFQHRNGTDSIRFTSWYQVDHDDQPIHNQLARVSFADGTSWDRQTIDALAAGATRQIAQSHGDDFMFGTRFDEVLLGGEGNDWIQAGKGNDLVDGGAGDDVYFFEPGDGVDVVRESGVGTFDVLQFGGTITPEDISLGLGSLLIRIESTGEAIHVEGFDSARSLQSGTIERFDFSDGTSLTYEELLALGFDLQGTSDDDVLTGTDVDDRMRGLYGDDTISSGDGNDSLDGGAGDDILLGGEGDDVYRFGAGYGNDSVIDSGGFFDSIRLGTGIDPDEVRVLRNGSTLTLSFSGLSDVLSIEQHADRSIEQLVFGDGTVWDAAVLESKIESRATAPVVLLPICDQITQEDAPFTFQVPDATFSGSGQALAFSATLDDGSLLPAWLTFDPVTRTFAGTPLNEDIGEIEVVLTASAGAAGSASDRFLITIGNANDRPLLAKPITDQWAHEDVPFSLSVPTGTFLDPDAGDVLTLHAALTNGETLPTWLRFDPLSGTLSGVPGNGDVGSVPVRITATDLDGEQASAEFTVNVMNVNDAPVLQNALQDLRTVERQPFSLTVPARTFSDLDVDDALAYQATLIDGASLPAWLTFDPQTRTFSGSPGEDDIGVYRVSLTAFDSGGSAASDDFTLEVTVLPGKSVIGTWRSEELSGTPGADTIHGLAGNDKLFGQAGRDVISGGAGNDRLDGGTGNDWLFGGTGNDSLAGDLGHDVLWAGEGNDSAAADAGDDFLYGQSGNDKLLGGAGRDFVDGGRGNDELSGDEGEDLLYGGADNDTLVGAAANDLLDAGGGNDALEGGDGNDFIAGGAGADVIKSGAGRDIIAFNRGDGVDTIQAGNIAEDTLSLGGGICYGDITLSKNGHDLVLNAGYGDRLSFKDWYSAKPARPIAKLQLIADVLPDRKSRKPDPLDDKTVQTFDFQALVERFDAARACSPKVAAWSVAPALNGTRISSSESHALGGVLAYEYATRGSTERIDPRAAFDMLAHPSFGAEPQAFLAVPPTPSDSEPPDTPGLRWPNACTGDPLRRLTSGLAERPLEDWAEKLENAIEQWLERADSRGNVFQGVNDGPERSSRVELDLAAAWQRTRDLLEMHLQGGRGMSEFEAEGAGAASGLDTLGGGRAQQDTLGRVSGHRLQSLNGLEEGLKALAA